jgi:hypothetical protein
MPMETQFTNLSWPEQMQIGAAVLGVSAILIVLYYYLKLTTISNLGKRHEYISTREINHYKAATVVIAVAVAMVFNSFIAGLFDSSFTFLTGIFLSALLGFIVGYALFAYFDVYYPFVLEKKLANIRFKPRVNPQNNHKMRLLNENEEDVHLSPEMMKHERAFAYDYDVWIDEETGYKLIERYDGHLQALLCEECNFRTLKDYKEVIIKSPTQQERGLLLKHYECTNCGHRESKEVSVAPLDYEESLQTIQTA